MKTDPLKDTELHDKINRETGRVTWSELERHFAHGIVIYVNEELDLVEVALRIAHDDKAAIARWMNDGKIAKVSDAQAQAWQAAEVQLWGVGGQSVRAGPAGKAETALTTTSIR